ncbi:uncharacterized protein LOC121383943 [Gigantopelta aegis]|uniref:uncharacterized protein LOC121383943 n=1 Tax=Gigantopelta aegis TaxID=1735272 RepID=UPI001B88C064|nr:uncharacterized protein LOC121383943 [Gigantopelta aegis]
MNSFMKIPLLVLLAGLASSAQAIANCRQLTTEIEHCFLPIYTLYGSSATGQVQFVEMGDQQQLDAVCSELHTAIQCTDRLLKQCHGPVVSDLVTNTLTDTFGYICGEGRQAMIDELSCWENPSFESSLAVCEHQSKMAARRATSMSAVCGILDNYKTCVQNRVTSLCNANAGNFIYNVFKHASASVSKQMGCDVHLTHTRAIMGLLARRGAFRK